MTAPSTSTGQTWSAATADELAAAAGADDLFVFRRVSERRFAHIGGAGRGAGWAGIVEVDLDDEPLVRTLAAGDVVLRRSDTNPWHVLGPYYGHTVAAVPVSGDVFVVFGASDDGLAAVSDAELFELARLAAETLVEVAPAKRLADELEAVTAIQHLLHSSAETFDDALSRLVDHATRALSCDLGVIVVGSGASVSISDRRGGAELDVEAAIAALVPLVEGDTPVTCVQDSATAELPAPFRSMDGVLSYYLLPVQRPVPGVLLLLHTNAVAGRGFTQLCQSLGRRLVAASEPLLEAALLRDSMQEALGRAEAEARRDQLTGLPNRLAWVEAIAAEACSPEEPSTVVKVDCRGLKQVNETLGHRAGDELLCRVAAILGGSVRSTDLTARIGGDEFSLLLRQADEEFGAGIVARVEAEIAGIPAARGTVIGLSIGAATCHDGDLEAAEQLADARMLESKRLGRAAAGGFAIVD